MLFTSPIINENYHYSLMTINKPWKVLAWGINYKLHNICARNWQKIIVTPCGKSFIIFYSWFKKYFLHTTRVVRIKNSLLPLLVNARTKFTEWVDGASTFADPLADTGTVFILVHVFIGTFLKFINILLKIFKLLSKDRP